MKWHISIHLMKGNLQHQLVRSERKASITPSANFAGRRFSCCYERWEPNAVRRHVGDSILEKNEAEPEAGPRKSEPIFNIPGILVVFVGVMVAIQLLRDYVLTEEMNIRLLTLMAF